MLAIVWQYGVVNALGSFLGVELTIVAILVLAFEVVDAIGNITGLLNLDNETACSDGVDSAGWDKEAVVLLHVILSQGIGDGIVLYHLLVLLRSNLHLQAVVELGIRLAWQRIPHLGLAAFLTLLLGNFIIRMHLDREVAVGIDKLDEQWKLIAETLVVLFSEEASLPFCNNLVEALALHLAIGYDAFIFWYSRDFPAFSHILLLYVEMLESDNLTATPDGGF